MKTRVGESARRERHAFERSFAQCFCQVFGGNISSDSVMDIVQITRTIYDSLGLETEISVRCPY